MDSKEKRANCQKQIINTLVRIAEIDDTCNLKNMIAEIIESYKVPKHTAYSYVNELVTMGTIERTYGEWNDEYVWHREEKEIRKEYLKRGKTPVTEEEIEINKINQDASLSKIQRYHAIQIIKEIFAGKRIAEIEDRIYKRRALKGSKQA